jgi:hypothetical protein
MRLFVAGFAFGVMAVGSAFAQNVVSAHSGVVHYVEGTAYLNNERVDPKFGQFPEIKQDQEFRTEEGRAEILLTPGVRHSWNAKRSPRTMRSCCSTKATR